MYFENVSLQKIKELKAALEKLECLINIMNTFTKQMKLEFKSERLRKLMTFEPEGMFPDLLPEIRYIESMLIWKWIGDQFIPEPAPGFSVDFDTKNQRVSEIKKEFKLYL